MNWLQIIAALYLLCWATFLYICDTATPGESGWEEL